MGIRRCLTVLVAFIAIGAGVVYYTCPCCFKDVPAPVLEDGYFGKGPVPTDATKIPKDDVAIKKFEIKVDEADLKDLKTRLSSTRFVEPLEDVQFQYGVRGTYLREVVKYWLTKFDWRKQEKELNKFSHFITQIEGINIHFIHQKPNVKGTKVRVIPLLLSHGWPGSITEFTKILPLLTTPKKDRDYVFEVICPSIPGFGYSEAPHRSGFSVSDAARVYTKLMSRLGFEKFYVQGGDWGSAISTAIAKVYPQKVHGVHVNMYLEPLRICGWTKYAVGYFFPNWCADQAEYEHFYPPSHLFANLLQETGYFHIQATKPDTIGASMADSPAGLAAYILGIFSVATNRDSKNKLDGGLTEKFSTDELLTNVMVYWTTNTMASAMRFYKEKMSAEERAYKLEYVQIQVPTGIASFPQEFIFPEFLIRSNNRNVVRYTRMPKGGHFAAMEEPQLLANDIYDFVRDVENLEKEKNKKTEI